jgi:hypothetical protein
MAQSYDPKFHTPVLLLVTSLIFFAALGWRILHRLSRAEGDRVRLKRRHLRLAKILVGALLAMVIINYNLQHSLLQMQARDQAPSFWENLVRTLARIF